MNNPYSFSYLCRLKDCLVIAMILLCSFVLADKQSSAESENEQPDCTTHIVRNVSTNIENTITRCSGEVVSNLVHQQPTPKNIDENSKENPNAHWDLINNFDNLAAQNSIAESTKWVKYFTLIGLIISGIGVVYLIKTVEQNRSMIQQIRAVNEIEFRPYFKISEIDVRINSNNPAPNKLSIYGQFTLENIGKSEVSEFTGVVVERGQVLLQRYLSTPDGKRLWITFKDWNFIDKNDWEVGTTISPSEKVNLGFSGELFGADTVDISRYGNDLTKLKRDFEFTFFFRGFFTYTDVVSQAEGEGRRRVCEFAINRLLNIIDTPMYTGFGDAAGKIISCKTIGADEKPTDYEPNKN